MMQQSARFYGVLVILAVLSYVLVRLNTPEQERVTVKRHNPVDYFSIDYQKKEMDEAGQPKSLLVAEKLTHYAGDGTTHLQHPVMTLYNNDNTAPWVIRSERGILQADGDNLLLQGKVKIQREARPAHDELIINTSELQVHLPTSFAKTTQWSEIISAANRTTGIGMRLTFKAPIKLTLLSHVKGYYEVR